MLGIGDDDDTVTLPPSVEHVDLDLRHGIVKGYSQYVTFVVSPSPNDDDRCTAQSVVGVQLARSPFNRVRISLDYAEPRLWTVDLSDSRHADGYGVSQSTDDHDAAGGDNSTQGKMAEVHVRIRTIYPQLHIFKRKDF